MPLDFGGTSIQLCIRQQFDPTFFVAETSVTRYKFLARIAGSDVTIKAAHLAKRRKQHQRALQSSIIDELKAGKVKIEAAQDVAALAKPIKDLQLQYENLQKDIQQQSQLKALKHKKDAALTELEFRHKKLAKLIALQDIDIAKVESLYQQINELTTKSQALQKLKLRLTHLTQKTQNLSKSLSKTLPSTKRIDDLEEALTKATTKAKTLQQHKNSIENLLQSLTNKRAELNTTNMQLEAKESELEQITADLEICPICEKPL